MAITMQKALFIDKDGTLVENVPFNASPEQVRLTKGIVPLLQAARGWGYRIVVVTNQSGIARGYFSIGQMEGARDRLKELLLGEGIQLDGFYYCPHHPEGTLPEYRIACRCRKPQPGLLYQAAGDLNLALVDSWMIGDILDDVEAGNRAQCRTILLVNGNETEWVLNTMRTPDFMVNDFATGIRLIEGADRAAAIQGGAEGGKT